MSLYDKQYIVKTIKKMLDDCTMAYSSVERTKVANSMFEFMNTHENFSYFLRDHKKFRNTVIAKIYELLSDHNIKLCPELEPNLRRCQKMINEIIGSNEDYITSAIQGHIDNAQKHTTSHGRAFAINSLFDFLVTHDNVDMFLEKHKKFRETVKEKISEFLEELLVQSNPILKSNILKCQQMIYNIEGCPQEVTDSYGDCPQEVTDSYGDCPQEVTNSYGDCLQGVTDSYGDFQ